MVPEREPIEMSHSLTQWQDAWKKLKAENAKLKEDFQTAADELLASRMIIDELIAKKIEMEKDLNRVTLKQDSLYDENVKAVDVLNVALKSNVNLKAEVARLDKKMGKSAEDYNKVIADLRTKNTELETELDQLYRRMVAGS